MNEEQSGIDINQLIEHLQGSCTSLDQAIADLTDGEKGFEDLTDEDFFKLDNAIFECTYCGWWYETSEAHESDSGDICTDCYEYQNENEEE